MGHLITLMASEIRQWLIRQWLNGDVQTMHPTKALLLETAVTLIDERGPQGFTVEELLETSGISKGSMYHHFEDFTDVIESAEVFRFARFIDEDIRAIVAIMQTVTSREEMFARFRLITEAASSPDRVPGRYDRAMIIGLAARSPRLAAALAAEQDRLTDALADIAREFQERGFLKTDTDPRVVAVLVQAYSFGKVVDDIAGHKVPKSLWVETISRIVETML